MKELEIIKYKMDNIIGEISPLVDNNIRIKINKYEKYRSEVNNEEIKEFLDYIISYFKSVRKNLKISYKRACNEINKFVEILYEIKKLHSDVLILNNKIDNEFKLIGTLNEFTKTTCKEMKEEIDAIILKMNKLKESIYKKSLKRENVKIYNYFNDKKIENYGALVSFDEKENNFDKKTQKRIKQVIEKDNLELEEIDYVIAKLVKYKKMLKTYKNDAYRIQRITLEDKNYNIEKRNNLWPTGRKDDNKDRTKNGPFEKLENLIDDMDEESLNILVLSCFSLNIFEVNYYDKNLNEHVAFSSLSSGESNYKGYLRRWIKGLEYYLKTPSKKENKNAVR